MAEIYGSFFLANEINATNRVQIMFPSKNNNNRAYLLRTDITKSHLKNHICQHRGMKTSTVTPFFITFLTSPCTVMTAYQVSSEIYGGFFYSGITLK